MKTLSISFRALGTVNSIEIPAIEDSEEYPEGGMEILREVRDIIRALNDRWSIFLPDSMISELNAGAGERAVEIDEDTLRILKDSIRYAALTDGAFDITSCPLSHLWSIGRRGMYIPSEDEISRVLPLIDYHDLILKKNTAFLRRKGQAVDLGGIAKGYAVDLTAGILRKHKLSVFNINYGGTVCVQGQEQKIGLRNPFAGLLSHDRILGEVTVKNECVVTSGTYERFFEKDGVRYHHILDVKTGRPSDTHLASVTLIGGNAEELDALCTSVMLMGQKAGTKLIRDRGIKGIYVFDDGKVFTTGKDVAYTI